MSRSAAKLSSFSQKYLATAITYHQQGHFSQAETLYRQVLQDDPNNPDALHLLSVLAYQANNFIAAEQLIKQAIKANPKIALFHKRLGDILAATKNNKAAKKSYAKAIKLDDQLFEAHNNLGLLFQQAGDLVSAIRAYQKALACKKDFAIAHNNLGNAYQQMGEHKKALKYYQQAITHQADFPEALYNLGNIYLAENQLTTAAESFQQALQIKPDYFAAYNSLGCAFKLKGELPAAVQQFNKALQVNPNYFDASYNLAKTQVQLGNSDQAMHAFLHCLKLKPDDKATRNDFVSLLQQITLLAYNAYIKREIEYCFSTDYIDYQKLVATSAQLLKLEYGAETTNLIAGNLFFLLLEKTVNEDLAIEKIIIETRNQLLKKFQNGETFTEKEIHLIASIAQQSFNNEYLYPITATELAAIDAIKNITQDDSLPFLICAMYVPLNELAYQQVAPNKFLQKLINHSIELIAEEQQIKQTIPSIGNSTDDTSIKVKAQYEQNPYPRWISVQNAPIDFANMLRLTLPHLQLPAFAQKPMQVLVAGCGTGKHPIHLALSLPQSHFLAVDLSHNSLAYAKRMAKQLQVNNIEFKQADILQLNQLTQKFHYIECIGVLHHMADPLAGWQVLVDLLEQGGLMRIGLYSQIARTAVTAARQQIAKLNLTPSNDNMREFRQQIIAAGEQDKLFELSKSTDFFNLSGFRDFVFHEQEHQLTLPMIKTMLEKLQLEFLGFKHQNPQIKQRYAELFPQDTNKTDLDLWHQFEQQYPETFASMYQFFVKTPSYLTT